MKNFIHNKKDPDTVNTTEPVSDEVLAAEDVETENLKNAIAQVMAEETAVLPHMEQLSSSIARESGLADDAGEAGNPDDETPAAVAAVPEPAVAAVPEPQAKISSWFVTFMTMRIPIVSWIYLLYLAFSRKTKNRRNFARAYLMIKLIFLVLGLIILFLVISMAMNILQDLLDYMAML